jgi:hypothetical protein
MKKAFILFSLLTMILACSEKTSSVTEAGFPTFTYEENGKEYLNIKKSVYYPMDIKSFDQYPMPYGEIKIDSLDGVFLVQAKFWMADSAFRNLAKNEGLSYSKTYILDTIYHERLFHGDSGFEVTSATGDTAIFHLKIKELNKTKNQIEGDWSMMIKCHFEDKRGIEYDTTFLSRFDADYIKEGSFERYMNNLER